MALYVLIKKSKERVKKGTAANFFFSFVLIYFLQGAAHSTTTATFAHNSQARKQSPLPPIPLPCLCSLAVFYKQTDKNHKNTRSANTIDRVEHLEATLALYGASTCGKLLQRRQLKKQKTKKEKKTTPKADGSGTQPAEERPSGVPRPYTTGIEPAWNN